MGDIKGVDRLLSGEISLSESTDHSCVATSSLLRLLSTFLPFSNDHLLTLSRTSHTDTVRGEEKKMARWMKLEGFGTNQMIASDVSCLNVGMI
ncbi:hypothetical protein NPIL_485121 [Nephila pilipes]|uniref:Uncharacterized protein n=1 Tax=Nephila pilipes TaxID=299642 RepID=A0A8X6PJL8_NEPPI|nr:hypothetical protein NPIL_485121 [Nephila pilipes]